MSKPIDPIAVKQAIKDGQLQVYEKRGCIYLRDGDCGDTVCILKLNVPKTCKVKVPLWDGEYYEEDC